MAEISINLYTQLQQDFGIEKAKTLANVIDAYLASSKRETELSLKEKKMEIKEGLKDDLVTKKDLALSSLELKGLIKNLEIKFNFMIALMIIALTLMNPLAVDLLRSFMK